tara:strand:- start:497 stop:643 length:147 start_codon:yes stop_codon:yes gene_type:complete
MKKVKLAKDYNIRHDIIICAGSEIIISENRAKQLKELIEGKINNKKNK